MGLMAVLATVAMLFAAFTAAILVRRTGMDWDRVTLPPIVWLNTVALALSSILVERARAAIRRGALSATVRHLGAASLLGGLFLLGQLVAWYALVRQGVFLPTNPHAAFFYMLSAVHGAHVIGGLGALGWTRGRAARGAYTADRYTGLQHTAIYWHFVGLIWVYLLVLLVTL
jgi:cytochrome c oxidase subunit 3